MRAIGQRDDSNIVSGRGDAVASAARPGFVRDDGARGQLPLETLQRVDERERLDTARRLQSDAGLL